MPRAPKPSPSIGDVPPIEGPRVRAVPAGSEHAAQIQACFEGAPDYFSLTEGSPPAPDAGARLVADAEGDDLRRVYLLVHAASGSPVGVLDLYLHHPEPGVGHVALLLFRESCQGLGYGKETSAALEESLRRAGYGALRLSVGDENRPAKAFWERIGFAEVGRLDRGVTVYEKKLG
jgi:ribosomal protein S18 acetylase RimI-like enzyme